MTTPRKKLIEVALPLEAINVASAREKSIRHGHPSTLHLWWARRPLAACRAVIFTSLVDDPDDPEAPAEFVAACRELKYGTDPLNDTPRQQLFKFIEKLVQWESTSDEQVLETARHLIRLCTDGNPPPLLDPFAGGGSIPLEAQRLGLEAHASDLNPVAVMINKALIEIPPKFAGQAPVNPEDRKRTEEMGQQWRGAAGLAADVRTYGAWMRERAWERIGHLYPTYHKPASPGDPAREETVIAWLWARTVKCPNPACGATMPLVSSFDLSKKKGRKAWVEPVIDRAAKQVRFEVRTGDGLPPLPPKVGRGAKFRCLVCGEVSPDQHIKDEGMAGRMGAQLMAVVTEGKGGRSYYAPTPQHEQAAGQAQPAWAPAGELADDPRNIWCKQYGLTDFADLFTARQLTALTTFSDLVAEARQQIYADALEAGWPDDQTPLREGGVGAWAYAEAVSVYLGMGVSKLADAQNSLCRWKASANQTIALFGRQAIPMVWDFAESNAFASAAGDYTITIGTMARALGQMNPPTQGYVVQADATHLPEGLAQVIATDPPYYDNIGYADLSDFFYGWLRHGIKAVFPEIFSTILVPKEPELISSAYRHGNKEAATSHFENGLRRTFVGIRTFVSREYPMTIYYAFKQQDIEETTETTIDYLDEEEPEDVHIATDRSSSGWETMLTSLVETGFSISGTWPMRTELGNRMIGMGTNALASSIVLVCRPRPESAPAITRRDFLAALKRELPAALREMTTGSIAPVDLAQASIGPGMAVYSRYSAVLEPDGARLGVRTALQLINQELDAYLAEEEGELDGDSRFAVAWFEQFGFNAGEFGTADVLARAKNTSVEGLANAGVLRAQAGRVQLIPWKELDPGWDPATDQRATAWEATHHLIEQLNSHGEQGAAMLLAKMPAELAAEARQLAYRLYSICERKGWAELARDYNMLVISWGAAAENAVSYRDQGGRVEQGKLFE